MSFVIKRDGQQQPLDAEKLRRRIGCLTTGLDTRFVSVDHVVECIVRDSFDGIPTSQLESLAAEQACYAATYHPDYSDLAGRIAMSNLHKKTSDSFSTVVNNLRSYVNPKNGQEAPLVSEDVANVVAANKDTLEAAIDYKRDYRYDFFGFKTLEKSYLLRVEDVDGQRVIAERPQQMLMRVSIGIHGGDIPKVLETYELLSTGQFTHASPTLFNSGTPRPQLSSCFLIAMKDDSIDGIYETLKDCALISKSAGGIGLHVHNIRSTGSYIRGTNGVSNGLVPMLRVFNDTARYVDQGGGKRKGAFAVYLEPWHGDIFEFLQLRKNHGKEEQRARDLFLGLWIPDLFMHRVEKNEQWSLFCPNEAPGLADVWGDAFEELYTKYEKEGKARKVVQAQDVWFAILDSQIETGTPYMLYKDACNRKSNQQHLGTIKCSNLCTEIVEYTDSDETAVCNLASLALPSFVKEVDGTPTYDHERLRYVTKVATRNLNRVIDVNYYPTPSTKKSNFRHRPIGLGVQGLADTFLKMKLAFDSDEAKTLNEDIFETIYFSAVETSCELAEKEGTFETYPGCPMSKGIFQFDMWGRTPKSGRWDWVDLKRKVAQFGVRNSLLVAPMPTASTSQILGNNECFEPFTSNVYVRRVLSGDFPVLNRYLVRDLIQAGLWTDSVRNNIISRNGSVQEVQDIPDHLKKMYRTVWEIKQKDLIDMAAARSAFIDQSSSLNLFLAEPTVAKLTSMHFYAWKAALKTGMYYLRTQAAADPIKFTVPAEAPKAIGQPAKKRSKTEGEDVVCTREMRMAGCDSCGS